VTRTSTATPQPVHTRRRTRWVVVAVLLLVVGIALLAYSLIRPASSGGLAAPSPSPTTMLSPLAQTETADEAPSPGGPDLPPLITVVTTYVAVPTYVPVPAANAGTSSDVVSVVSAISGFAASVLGLVSAFVSIRGSRPRVGGAA
jgi:hypothetical protein